MGLYALIDGSNVLKIALKSSSYAPFKVNGKSYGGMYGFLLSLRTKLEFVASHFKTPVTNCIVIWDHSHSTRRLEIYDSYKDKRVDNSREEEEFQATYTEQVAYLHKMLPFIGVRSFVTKGKEADDVIGQFVKFIPTDNQVMIVSCDGDMRQFISSNVSVYRPNLKAVTAIVEGEKDPAWTVIMKSLAGDESDCIKGIKGIGNTTVSNLLKDFKGSTFVDFIEHVLSLESDSKRMELLLQGLPIACRNAQLIDCYYEQFSEEEVNAIKAAINQISELDLNKLHKMFTNLQFTFMLQDFDLWIQPFLSLAAHVEVLKKEGE